MKKQAEEDAIARADALQQLTSIKNAELASALAEAEARLTAAVNAERVRGESAVQRCREELEAVRRALQAECDAAKAELARLEDM